MIYFDSAYLVKCYLTDPDSEKVRKLAAKAVVISSSSLCLAEFACAVHRAVREKSIAARQGAEARQAFLAHVREGVIGLIPVSDKILDALLDHMSTMPSDLFLRSGDALHLASARQAGFSEIWTNDRHMLRAASHFGILGRSA